MGDLNFTAMEDLLKYVYNGQVQTALNNSFPMLKRWKKASDRYRTGDGKAFLIPIRTSRGNSFGGIPDGGTLPTYDAPDTEQAVVNVRYLAGVYRVTGPSMAASGKKSGSVKSAMDFARDSLIEDIDNRLSKYLMLDGTGILAQIGAAGVAGTTFTLNGAAGFGTFMLEEGEYVATITTGGAFRSRHKIVTINHSTNTIVVDSAGSAAATDYLVYCRSDAAALAQTDYGLVPHGLGFKGGMLDQTATYEGLNPSTVTKWKPTTVAAGGNPLSQDYLDETYLRTRNRGGKAPSLIVANDGMLLEFRGLIEDQRRYNDLKVPVGSREVTYSLQGKDQTVYFDRFVPSGYIGFLDESSLLTFESREGGFDDLMGNSTLKYVGADAVQAVWLQYVTWGTDARFNHGVLTGVSQSVVIRPGE